MSDDAQRTLERKAVRNVRALIDKIEAEERPRPIGVVLASNLGLVVVGLVAFVAVVMLAMHLIKEVRREPAKPPPQTVAEYVDQMVAKIQKRADQKHRAEVQGLEGRVKLELEVDAKGYLRKFEVAQSSWNTRADDQALQLTKAAEPFGRMPRGIDTPIRMTATFHFGKIDSGNPSSLSIAGQPMPR